MKNNLLIRATGVSADSSTRRVSGMCKGRGALVRSGEPHMVCEENVVPLTHYPADGDGREILIAMRNNVVGRICENGFRAIFELPQPVTCAAPGPDGVTLMTPGGAWMLQRCSDSWNCLNVRSIPVGVIIQALPAAVLTATVTATTLRSAPGRDGTLSQADIAAIGGKLRKAYLDLWERALASGLTLVPAVAGWKVVDRHGGLLHRAPLRIVVPYGGIDDNISVSATLEADGMTIPSTELSVTAYCIEAILPGEWDNAPEGCTIEMFAGPVCGAAEAVGEPKARVENPSGNSPVITVGLSITTTPGDTLLSAAQYESTTRVLPAIESQVATVRCATLRKVGLETTITSFSAGCCAVSGDTVLWGNITELRTPAGPGDFCTELGLGEWTGMARVHFADGSCVTTYGQGNDHIPTSLAPAISYPSASAQRLEVWIRRATGTVYTAEVNLTPLAGNNRAVWINNTMSPLPLEQTTSPLPGASASERHTCDTYPGMVAATPVHSPCSLIAAASCGGEAVRAITPAARTSSVWNPGCAHFYAWSRHGSYAAAVTGGAVRTVRVSVIDSVGVRDSSMTAFGTDGAGVCAPDGLRVYHGTHSTTLGPVPAVPPDRLGYDQRRRMWVAATGGCVSVIDSDGTRYDEPVTGVSRLTTIGNELYACTGEGLLNLADVSHTGSRAVEWVAQCDAAGLPGAGTLILHATGSDLALRLTVTAGGADMPEGAVLLDLNLNGSLKSSLRLPWRLPPGRDRIRVALAGTAGGDWRLEGISVEPYINSRR